jgi:hypothetical protein
MDDLALTGKRLAAAAASLFLRGLPLRSTLFRVRKSPY